MQSPEAAWPAHDELSRLVRAARTGEPRALNDLLTAVRPSLVAFFGRRTSAATGEDLAQVALMRIALAVERIDPERADRYVMTVARNLLRTEFRRRARDARRHVPLDLADDVEGATALDRESEHRELARAIHRASLDMLPAPLREIVLALLRGLTPGEIAEQQRLNPITIRTRLLRARALLRRELSPYLEVSEGGSAEREHRSSAAGGEATPGDPSAG